MNHSAMPPGAVEHTPDRPAASGRDAAPGRASGRDAAPGRASRQGAGGGQMARCDAGGGLNRANRPFTDLDPALAAWDTRTLPELLRYALTIGDSLGFAVYGDSYSGTWGDVLRANPVMAMAESLPQPGADLPSELSAVSRRLRDAPLEAESLLDEAEDLARREYALQRGFSLLSLALVPADPEPALRRARALPVQAADILESLALEQGVSRDRLTAQAEAQDLFVPSTGPGMAPHVALLVAFLRLLRKGQAAANALPAEYLRYFYLDYLGLAPAPPEPDSTALVFTGPEDQRLLLPQGFAATGEGPGGGEAVFILDSPVPVTPAAITRIVGLRPAGRGSAWRGLREWRSYAGDNGRNPWQPFAADREKLFAATVLLPLSPLRLGGGERRAVIDLLLRNNESDRSETRRLAARLSLDPPLLEVSLSGGQGWLRPAACVLSFAAREENLCLRIEFTLGEEDPPVLPAAGYGDQPVLRLRPLSGAPASGPDGPSPDEGPNAVDQHRIPGVSVPEDDSPADNGLKSGAPESDVSEPGSTIPGGPEKHFWWRLARNWLLYQAEVAVSVSRMRPDALITAGDELPAEGSCTPFGAWPRTGDSLDVLVRELRGREVLQLDLHWSWPDMPESFARYFREYPDFAPIVVQGALHADGVWRGGAPATLQGRDGDSLSLVARDGEPAVCGNGRCRVTLMSGGSLFGQSDYPALLLQATLNETRLLRRLWCFLTGRGPRLKRLNPPLLPLWEDVRVSYRSRSVLRAGDLRLIRREPFGGAAVNAPAPLWTSFEREELFLGLNGADEGPLNVYLRLASPGAEETAVPPDEAAGGLAISLLRAGAWRQLSLCPPPFGGDGTNGLTHSGLISLALPGRDMEGEAPQRLDWLRIAWPEQARDAGLLGLHLHAGIATRRIDPAPALNRSEEEAGEDEAVRLLQEWPLPAGSIDSALSDAPKVEGVEQPYPSEGGSPPEDESAFFQRSAEFLRHRDRAVTAWDYERLALNRFPEIGAARCLPHTLLNANGCPVETPGHLTLVVFAPGPGVPDPCRPPATPEPLLEGIGDFLRSRATPFARIHVRGPHYEAVHCRLEARLKSCWKADDAVREIAALLRSLCAPWSGAPLAAVFGASLNRQGLEAVPDAPFFDKVFLCRFDAQSHGLTLAENGRRAAPGEPLRPTGPAGLFFAGTHSLHFTETP